MKLTTAKKAGLAYLGLAITGVFAYVFTREQIYVDGDAVATTANLVKQEGLARFGIAAEIGVVLTQALAAVYFYKLFRKKDNFTAGLIAIFGMVNSVIILTASAFWLTALNNALAGGQAASTQLLFNVHENLWLVGSLFFGLWLIPMAYMANVYKFPKGLVWFLALGGVGYILSTFTAILLPEQTGLTEVLPMPASIGEFWMIGYILLKNVKE